MSRITILRMVQRSVGISSDYSRSQKNSKNSKPGAQFLNENRYNQSGGLPYAGTPNPNSNQYGDEKVDQRLRIPEFHSIQSLIEDENSILMVLNAYAQNTKESLRWRLKSDNGLTVAEITIGNLSANAVNNNKRLAKLNASKNLLKIVDSNTFLKEKFNYFMREMRNQNKQGGNSGNGSNSKPANFDMIIQKKAILEKDCAGSTKTTELKEWFAELNKRIEATDNQKETLKNTFEEMNDILSLLFPEHNISLLPIGSYLNGATRSRKLEADCIVVTDKDKEELTLEVLQAKLEEMKKGESEIPDSQGEVTLLQNYTFSLSKNINAANEECLTIRNRMCGHRVNLFRFNDSQTTFENESGKVINKHNSLIFHAIWLDESLTQGGVSEEIIKIMRIVREWKDKQYLNVSTEILDLAVYYCTFNFKEFDIIKVLLKFFALLNLLINKYNFYFYELSEYHSYLIDNLNEDTRKAVIKKAQETFLKLANNNPSDFF